MNYSSLAKSYSTLHYSKQLRETLQAFFKEDSFDEFTKFELQKKFNDALFDNYEGEEILKYKLAKLFKEKKYVAAFEVKARNSRTDFLVINGLTKSFEVKSKIDNLSRLSKQATDYSDVFEYNTVVIDSKHLKAVENILPEYYGIWYFELNKKIEYRKAEYSPNLNAKALLELLNKKELITFFNNYNIDQILNKYTLEQINTEIKKALKKRYEQRWQFLKTNWEKILPIDIQFFFNSNIKPELIYY
jgi:hypothetical protein